MSGMGLQKAVTDLVLSLWYVERTLEQQGFELPVATYTQILFTKYILRYYTICGWLYL